MGKISVLLGDQADRFDAYCKERGFKKSTLIARLIREHLDREGFASQPQMFADSSSGRGSGSPVKRKDV